MAGCGLCGAAPKGDLDRGNIDFSGSGLVRFFCALESSIAIKKLDSDLGIASRTIKPRFCRLACIRRMSITAQNGNNANIFSPLNSTHCRVEAGRFRFGLWLITSARDCNITASSKPIVAANVGDITNGRSGNNDEGVVGNMVGDMIGGLVWDTAVLLIFLW